MLDRSVTCAGNTVGRAAFAPRRRDPGCRLSRSGRGRRRCGARHSRQDPDAARRGDAARADRPEGRVRDGRVAGRVQGDGSGRSPRAPSPRSSQASAPSCTIETSTGTGIASVSVASDRVVWLAYGGGNIREWALYTAPADEHQAASAPVRRAKRRRAGADRGRARARRSACPYAVNREIVYLGEDGVRLFKVIADSPVRLIAAGPGPFGIRVVALTAEGRIVPLAADGSAAGDNIVVDGVVKALRLFAGGVAYQVGNVVNIVGPRRDRSDAPGRRDDGRRRRRTDPVPARRRPRRRHHLHRGQRAARGRDAGAAGRWASSTRPASRGPAGRP